MEESNLKTNYLIDATYPSWPLISHFLFQPKLIIVIIIFVKHVSLADDSYDCKRLIWNKFVQKIYMCFSLSFWLVKTCVEYY